MSIVQSINAAQLMAPMAQPSKTDAGPFEDFGAMLARLASDSIGTIRQGEAAAASGLAGTVPIHEVVDKVMAAEQALHTGLALRDKIVAAYLEISRMSI